MRIAIILIIIGLIVGGVFYGYTQNQKKMRIEAMALAKEIELAEEKYTSIADALEGLDEYSPKVRAVMSTASNIVPGIVGAANAPRVYDRDFGKKKAMPVKKAASGGKPAKEEKQSTSSTLKTGVVLDEFGREAPAGFVARDMKKKKEELAAARKPQDEGASETSSSSGDSRLDERIKKAQEYIEKIRENCAIVEARIDESAYILSESEKILAEVKASPVAFRAKKARAGFNELVPMAKDLRSGILNEIDEAEAVVPKLEAMKAEVEAEKKAAAEAAARKREVQEREARRKSEIARAENWYSGKAQLIRSYQFEDVAKELKGVQDALTFEEAKRMLDIPIKRYTLAARAMTWLRGAFNKAPLTWGWKTAGGALDIESADEKGIYVQEKLIPWLEIPKDRLLGFFSHYLKRSEDVGKSKAELYIGAAVFAKTFGKEDFVDEFVDKAEIESEVAAREIPALMNFNVDSSLTGD